jgi:endogenous inhibitor of DNA gyrase (YacG/DUF329 family)
MMMFQTLCRSMAPHERLSAECERCARKAVWSREEAFRLFGPDAAPAEIRRRLVCADCGTNVAVRVWI